MGPFLFIHIKHLYFLLLFSRVDNFDIKCFICYIISISHSDIETTLFCGAEMQKFGSTAERK